jgi:hypothetical protein
MSKISSKTPEILEDSLLARLGRRAAEECINLTDKIPSDLFANLIEDLYKKYNQRVVVLIDEYDKPILDHMSNLDVAEANRQVLRGFYGILKSMDPFLKFVLLTGVTKFTKASIFSELNNLYDITLDEAYANICGIPVDDLVTHFGDHINDLVGRKGFESIDSIKDEILAWYDGYSWDGETRVINPFSLLSFFSRKRFSSFWYSSGSPKFLIDMIKEKPESYLALKNMSISEGALDLFDIEKIELELLFFQTGYLTIKDVSYDMISPVYHLTVPNLEVREALNLHIIAELTEKGTYAYTAYRQIYKALQSGDLQQTRDMLRGLFASIPYQLHVDMEAYYHSLFYAVMTVLGFDMDVEVSVSRGRVDAVLELRDKVYVMEFKYEKCPPNTSSDDKQKLFDAALTKGMEQINEKGYHKKYIGSGKTIYLAAFAFLGRDDIEMSVTVCG